MIKTSPFIKICISILLSSRKDAMDEIGNIVQRNIVLSVLIAKQGIISLGNANGGISRVYVKSIPGEKMYSIVEEIRCHNASECFIRKLTERLKSRENYLTY